MVVVAVLFLNKKYFKNISDYKEGSVFVSSDEEIFKESKSFYGKEELIINYRYYNFNILEKKNIYIDYIDSKILCNDFYYQQILKEWLKKPNCLCNEKNLDILDYYIEEVEMVLKQKIFTDYAIRKEKL